MAMEFRALLRDERRRAAEAATVSAPAPAPRPSTVATVSGHTLARAEPPPPLLALSARAPRRLSRTRALAAGPCDVLYDANFFEAHEERALRECVLHPAFADSWRQLRGRTLLNFGGEPTADGIALEPLPQFCAAVCDALVQTGIFPVDAPPNHVLINRYEPGQGLMPHQDGPLYEPLVAIVSLGGPAMLDFWESVAHSVRGRAEHGGALPAASYLCEPRSLLVFHGDAYARFFHGIAERTADPMHGAVANAHMLGDRAASAEGALALLRGERLSLTVRRVSVGGAASGSGTSASPGAGSNTDEPGPVPDVAHGR
ncbi:hypothetical protein KFE25_013496 [Diacronema lutheri]|uniref:Fe2OG dioxygenase domain-containing protein n=2 Tax=Diacronema lutheri TaxID=2081491 RepID=A0A8J6CI41_DIALT|nr:hypothetical protein KFE25_013496 [Diacronema lutheri]